MIIRAYSSVVEYRTPNAQTEVRVLVGPPIKKTAYAVFLIGGPKQGICMPCDEDSKSGAMSLATGELGPRVLNRFWAKRRNIFSNSWESPLKNYTCVLTNCQRAKLFALLKTRNGASLMKRHFLFFLRFVTQVMRHWNQLISELTEWQQFSY